MRRMCHLRYVAALLTAASITSAFAGGAKESTAAVSMTKPIHLKVWISAFAFTSQRTLPKGQWYMSEAIKRFEGQKPGTRVSYDYITYSNDMGNQWKAAALAGNGPDIVSRCTGSEMFQSRASFNP